MSVLFVALVVGIVSYVGIMYLFPKAAPQDGNERMREALDRIYAETRGEDEQRSILRDQLNDENPLVKLFFSLGFMRPLYESGLQAGYQGNLESLIYKIGALFVLSTLFLIWLGVGVASPLIALALAYVWPLHHCRKRIHRRNRKFIDQFPDALDMIVRSVRSGFPLSVALQMLAENTEYPVKEEFRAVVDDIALGRSLQQALQRLALRINQPDTRFFVVVLSVQQETGGNLAEIIGNLSNVIRKRKQLRHKIHAMTSEGRATAWVLGLLPVFVFSVLFFFQRDYLEPFWTDELGMILFGTSVSLVVVCAFVVKQMINVDI